MIRNLLFKNKILICLSFIFIGSGVALVHVGQDVYKKKNINKKLQKDIAKVEREIASLDAEIAFLTSPQRLDKIVSAVGGHDNQRHIPVVKNAQYNQTIELVRMIKPVQKPYIQKASLRQEPQKIPHKKNNIQVKNAPSQNASFLSVLDDIGGYE